MTRGTRAVRGVPRRRARARSIFILRRGVTRGGGGVCPTDRPSALGKQSRAGQTVTRRSVGRSRRPRGGRARRARRARTTRAATTTTTTTTTTIAASSARAMATPRIGVGRRAWRRCVEGARATTTTATATTAARATARASGARATTTTTRARAREDRATAIGAWEAIRERARAAPDATATANAAGDGDATYAEVMALAARVAEELKALDVRKGDRVGLAATAGMEYCAAAYATWARGGVSVPIASSHSEEDAAYVMRHSGMRVVLIPPLADGEEDSETYEKYARVATRFDLTTLRLRHVRRLDAEWKDADADGAELDDVVSSPDDGALIIYTSGTTGRPKGALHTHRSLYAQCAGLIDAWRWDPSDRIIHALPLHHIHGIVNAWLCAHVVGATVEFHRTFTPRGVWARLRDAAQPPVTVFMGVPTMYVMLMRALQGNMAPEARAESIAAASRLRLTVSGSAACPVPVLEDWRRLTGRSLLERYGMTEIGMALSNPYEESKHKPGYVGLPLPGVQVKLAPLVGADGDEDTSDVDSGEYLQGPGELLVKGDNLFTEYYDNAEATSESFDESGYFKTGDVAAMASDGFWRILGRASVDVLKIGGFKVSALEIEARLLENPSIAEVAVLGIPDEAYGQRAVALVVLALDMETGEPVNLTEGDVTLWVRQNLASKMHLRVVKFADKMPRNAMGKVNKKDLQRTHFAEYFEQQQ